MATDDPHDPGGGLLGGLTGPGRSTYGALLADVQYRRFFLATFVSSLGDWVGLFAILALTESIVGHGQASRATAFAFSGVMIARILPIMVLGPVAGVYADRWDRKRTLVATDIGRALVMAAVPFSPDFLMLFVLSFLVEVLSMLFAPAKEATLPNIVPRKRLVQANQLTLTVTYGSLPLGGVLLAAFTALAGWIAADGFLAERPAALAVWVNAATFLVSASLFARIRIPHARPPRAHGHEDDPSAWQQLVEGFRFLASRPRVRALIAGVMAAAFAGGALFSLAKLFVTVLQAGDAAFGFLIAATGAGLFLGLIGAVQASSRFGNDRAFPPGIGIGGAFAVVVALMPNIWLASAAAFVMGSGAGLAFVTGYTLLQEATDDTLRGRAFAAFNTGVRLALMGSLVLAPLVVGLIGTTRGAGYRFGGVRITMAGAGLIALAGAVWSARQLHRARSGPSMSLTQTSVGRHKDGLFVVFEGGEGAGKTTQVRLLRAAIERAGFDVVVSREPGGTELGEAIRRLVLDPHATVDDRAEALLYAAARAQHASELIRPALEKGAIVLSDRYVDSSIVYQGAARDLGEADVEELNAWATDGLVPDLVVLLDLDPDVGLERAGHRPPDRLESQGIEFHRRVNEGFRQLAARDPDRFLVVDATRPAEEIHAEVRRAVLSRLVGDTGPQDTQPHRIPAPEEVP